MKSTVIAFRKLLPATFPGMVEIWRGIRKFMDWLPEMKTSYGTALCH
jgi:hypothetical protein